MVPTYARRAFMSTEDLRNFIASIDDSFFDRELVARHSGGDRSGGGISIEIMVPEYKRGRDTQDLRHFGTGPISKQRALAYLDGTIAGEKIRGKK